MSETLKHECGIALVRLLKPKEYYIEKYGTWRYGLNKLYLLMEKQHNRGQQGAGIGCVDAKAGAGTEYIFRERALGNNAIKELFQAVHNDTKDYPDNFTGENVPYCGEVYMGHLRYSTTGRSGMSYIHPFLRRNNWRSRSLMLCGNFSMTNVDEIFNHLVNQGQHPRLYSDTLMILEMMGNHLDREVQKLYDKFKQPDLFENRAVTNEGDEMNRAIAEKIDLAKILRKSAAHFDGEFDDNCRARLNTRLATVFNRGFWDGYYMGRTMGEWSTVYGSAATERKVYVGDAIKYYSRLGVAEFSCKAATVSVGEKLLITGPTTGALYLTLEDPRVELNSVPIVEKGVHFSIKVPEKVRPSDKLYKIISTN